MAITSAICNSFKTELAEGHHDFRSAGDQFYLALYTSSATLSASTTAYTTTGEVVGTGYTAGGKLLTNANPILSGSTAIIDWADLIWSGASFTARGCMIYNFTDGGAICVIDFGADKTASGGTFSILFPTADITNAIIRIT